jgi:mannose-6-phosphate isomerase-like protein (cupin superfamily)
MLQIKTIPMKHLLSLMFFCAAFTSMAQKADLKRIKHDGTSLIQSKRIFGDSLATSFVILIKKEVKAHKHMLHSEHVYILEGSATMRLGEESFTVSEGDLIFIPKGAVHAVKVTSDIPLKVISLQSPHFDGTDRVMVE